MAKAPTKKIADSGQPQKFGEVFKASTSNVFVAAVRREGVLVAESQATREYCGFEEFNLIRANVRQL